jgi:dihydrofolate reductase
MKVTAYFAASLDGYIAKADGSIDWLDSASAAVPAGEDCGFQAFMNTVDTLVMGRKTFEQILSFGEWAYGATPVVVLSRKPLETPATVPDSVSHSSESIDELCDRLEGEGVEHIYVDGGATTQSFLAAGRLNEIIVTVIPVLLGGGISPFGRLETEVKLSLLGVEEFDFGFVQMRYAVGAIV